MRKLLLVAALVASAHAEPRWPRAHHVNFDGAKSLDPIPWTGKPAEPSLSDADAKALLAIQLGPAPKQETVQKLSESIVDDPTASKYFELAMEFAKGAVAMRAVGDTKSLQMSKDFLLKGVKTFRALVDNDKFRDFAQRDVALFYYGYLLADAKYMKEARAVWDRILKEYPSSTFIPATYLQFAEYYSASQQLPDAEALYKKVLQFPKADGYWYAQYRLGWVHMKSQRYQEALETMFEIVKGAPKPALVAAARTDFVAAYTEIGKPDRALEAFRRVDGGAADAMYQALADRYIAKGDFEKAAIVYRDLATREPKDPLACKRLLTSARLWAQTPGVKNGVAIQLPSEQQAASQIEALASFAKLGECKADVSVWINIVARATHNAAIQHQRSADDAIRFYRLALDLDPSFETRWLLAEAVWLKAENLAASQSDKPTSPPVVQAWSDAGRAFLDIARDTGTPADRSREAALGAVFAYANAMSIDPDLAKLVGPGAKKLTPLSSIETAYIGAADLYQTIVRDSKDLELARMRFVIATLHRRHGDHAKAVPVLVDFLAAQRDSPLADAATAMMLDSQQAIDLPRSRSPRR